jgi:hypothetical protein
MLFYSLKEVGFHCTYVFYAIYIFCISFHFQHNLDQLYQSILFLIISRCITTIWLGYRELGLELVSLRDNHSRRPKQPPVVEENRDDGLGYPLKKFLKESLT